MENKDFDFSTLNNQGFVSEQFEEEEKKTDIFQNPVQQQQKKNYELEFKNYIEQSLTFPEEGRHIMCHQNDKSLVVYQAFNINIAKYAVENQKFGGQYYQFNRTSWIKTNFLWMMYRSGWASKKGQERILAIWLPKKIFIEQILENSYTVNRQKREKIGSNNDIDIRLQWDPDYTPNLTKLPRRAIQLGIKKQLLSQFSNEWIEKIEDITDIVKKQKQILDKEGMDKVSIPIETQFIIKDKELLKKLDMIY